MANEMRCDASVPIENDPNGENAVNCGAVAFACASCSGSAGCIEHAHMCQKCGEWLCEACLPDHRCQAKRHKASGEEKKTRAA